MADHGIYVENAGQYSTKQLRELRKIGTVGYDITNLKNPELSPADMRMAVPYLNHRDMEFTHESIVRQRKERYEENVNDFIKAFSDTFGIRTKETAFEPFVESVVRVEKNKETDLERTRREEFERFKEHSKDNTIENKGYQVFPQPSREKTKEVERERVPEMIFPMKEEELSVEAEQAKQKEYERFSKERTHSGEGYRVFEQPEHKKVKENEYGFPKYEKGDTPFNSPETAHSTKHEFDSFKMHVESVVPVQKDYQKTSQPRKLSLSEQMANAAKVVEKNALERASNPIKAPVKVNGLSR